MKWQWFAVGGLQFAVARSKFKSKKVNLLRSVLILPFELHKPQTANRKLPTSYLKLLKSSLLCPFWLFAGGEVASHRLIISNKQ